MPRLLRLLTLAAAVALPAGAGAQPPPAADDTVTRGTTADPAPPAGPAQPIIAYFLALLGTGGALLIICTPARKA